MNEQKHAVLRDATQHAVLRDFGKHRHLVRDILEWKHRIRELEAGLVRHRHARDELAGCLDRYPFLPPESKLRLGK